MTKGCMRCIQDPRKSLMVMTTRKLKINTIARNHDVEHKIRNKTQEKNCKKKTKKNYMTINPFMIP